MDTQLVTTIVSGIFSLVAAFGSIFLKDALERRRAQQVPEPEEETSSHETIGALRSERSYSRPLLVAAGAWILGNISRALRPVMEVDGVHYESLLSLAILIAASISLAFYHGRSLMPGRQASYQMEVFAMWAGYVSGWSVVHGAAWSDLITVSLLWWLGCAVVGGMVVVFKARNTRPQL